MSLNTALFYVVKNGVVNTLSGLLSVPSAQCLEQQGPKYKNITHLLNKSKPRSLGKPNIVIKDNSCRPAITLMLLNTV